MHAHNDLSKGLTQIGRAFAPRTLPGPDGLRAAQHCGTQALAETPLHSLIFWPVWLSRQRERLLGPTRSPRCFPFVTVPR